MAIRTVFMGSSEFSTTILKKLSADFPIYGVITQPDKPAGRGNKMTPPPVKVIAEELGLPVFQPLKLRAVESFDVLGSWQPDLIVVAAYGQILRQNVLDLPRHGCINVHGSYLPRWRGASPIQSAILNGDCSTGVTIMKMDAGVDTGPELAKAIVPITNLDNYVTLSQKLAVVGADLLVNTLHDYISGKIGPIPQVEEGVTYAPLMKKEDGLLDFQENAESLERRIRAFVEWPVCSMTWEGILLKIRKAEVEQPSTLRPGQRGVINGTPAVGTLSGNLILLEVQPAGKNWMKGQDFLRGARNWIN